MSLFLSYWPWFWKNFFRNRTKFFNTNLILFDKIMKTFGFRLIRWHANLLLVIVRWYLSLYEWVTKNIENLPFWYYSSFIQNTNQLFFCLSIHKNPIGGLFSRSIVQRKRTKNKKISTSHKVIYIYMLFRFLLYRNQTEKKEKKKLTENRLEFLD